MGIGVKESSLPLRGSDMFRDIEERARPSLFRKHGD